MKPAQNPYDDILNEIDGLLTKGEVKKALALIEEELSMPYIPPFVEAKLKQFRDIAKTALKMNEEIHLDMSEEGILSYLKQDELHQLRALEAFSVMNMRNYLALVQQAFETIESRLLKCLLIKLTIEQALTNTFSFDDEGIHYSFIPASLTLPEDSEGVGEARLMLTRWLEADDPSMLKLCQDQLEMESLMKLPETVDPDEAFDLAYSILEKIFLMLSDEKRFIQFCAEKGIRMSKPLALFN